MLDGRVLNKHICDRCRLLGCHICCLIAWNVHMARDPLQHHSARRFDERFWSAVSRQMYLISPSDGTGYQSKLLSCPEVCCEQSTPKPRARHLSVLRRRNLWLFVLSDAVCLPQWDGQQGPWWWLPLLQLRACLHSLSHRCKWWTLPNSTICLSSKCFNAANVWETDRAVCKNRPVLLLVLQKGSDMGSTGSRFCSSDDNVVSSSVACFCQLDLCNRCWQTSVNAIRFGWSSGNLAAFS